MNRPPRLLGAPRLLAALAALVLLAAAPARAEALPRDEIARHVIPPFALGEQVNDKGVWELVNSGGAQAGYVFETEPMAPLPGISGAPINMLFTLDLDGRFVDVKLVSHNEPIFVSGLGETPFQAFFEQYGGRAISDSIVVGSPCGAAADGSGLVYLDGVTKATASVRIPHESLIAAAREVAREKMRGIAAAPPPRPDMTLDETLTWDDLVAQGLVGRATVTNADVDAAFVGTVWADDDLEGSSAPGDAHLDLWVVDLGPPAIARAVLSGDTLADLDRFREISPDEEPILVVEAARHGLVSDDFVRNTAPDRLSAAQDGLPVALRDADLFVTLAPGVPDALHDGTAMILRTDRRLGFDPTREWVLNARAVRAHGMFQPEIGSVDLPVVHATDARFFERPSEVRALPPWREALRARQADLVALGAFLALLTGALLLGQSRLAGLAAFTRLRLGVLAVVIGFIGWWGHSFGPVAVMPSPSASPR